MAEWRRGRGDGGSNIELVGVGQLVQSTLGRLGGATQGGEKLPGVNGGEAVLPTTKQCRERGVIEWLMSIVVAKL